MATALKSHFNSVREWVKEVDSTKQASSGSMGKTTSPTAHGDDGTQKATTGARAAENDRDVEKYNPGVNVESRGELGRDQDDLQPNMGTHQSEVGKDPSVEKDYKDRPTGDRDTASPASSEVGEKYSFDLSKPDGLTKAAQALGDLANHILADIATETKQAIANPAPQQTSPAVTAAQSTPAPANTEKTASAPAETKIAVTAGYELAGMLGLSKDAADHNARVAISGVIRQALTLGDRVGQLLTQEAQKRAAEDMPPPPPDAGGAGPGAGGPDMAAMLGGAGGPGGPPPAPPGPGAGPDPAKLQELAMALQEAGIPLEALCGAGGPPPGAGAPPPGGPEGPPPGPGGEPPMPEGAKIAKIVRDYQRSGQFRYTEAKEGSAERKLRDEFKKQVIELVGNK